MVLNNAKQLMKRVLSSAETKGLIAVDDVSGTTRYIADFSAYPAVVEDSFTLVAADAGISVGSGTTAVAANNYQLQSTITSGLTGSVTTSSSVDLDGNAYVMFTVTLTNTSQNSITVSEIGYKQEISASDTEEGTVATDRVVLLDRNVFDAITITAGGQAKIGYRIKPVVSNDGGVLKTKTIRANGTYRAYDDDADGYSQVTVNITPNVQSKTVTANGTYSAASESLDGYSVVTVNVSSSGGFDFTTGAAAGSLNQGYATSTLLLDDFTLTAKAEEGI